MATPGISTISLQTDDARSLLVKHLALWGQAASYYACGIALAIPIGHTSCGSMDLGVSSI